MVPLVPTTYLFTTEQVLSTRSCIIYDGKTQCLPEKANMRSHNIQKHYSSPVSASKSQASSSAQAVESYVEA